MFRMPAYDPVAIAVMGCGILLAAALAFPYLTARLRTVLQGLDMAANKMLRLMPSTLGHCSSTHVSCRMVNLKV
jgi:hypothetical protein